MLKNHHIAKAISEVSWVQFRKMLEYKAKWYGKTVIAVNPQYTSQTCNKCGHVAKENRKTQSEFECVACGHIVAASSQEQSASIEEITASSESQSELAQDLHDLTLNFKI
jgi:ribosomal protein S27E